MAILDHHHPILKLMLAVPIVACTVFMASQPGPSHDLFSTSNTENSKSPIAANLKAYINPNTGAFDTEPSSEKASNQNRESATPQNGIESSQLNVAGRSHHPLVRVSFTNEQNLHSPDIEGIKTELENNIQSLQNNGEFNQAQFIQAPDTMRSHLIATVDQATQTVKFSHASHNASETHHE